MKTAIKAASALAFILIFSVSLFAEGYPTSTPAANATAVVSGTVLDNATGETLAGVAVTVEGTETRVYTDLDGNFTISGLQPGKYNLILSMISYKNSLVENVQLQANEKEVIDIKLDNK
ncbi:MAG: carboxypeptidase-like regulatory domain-containing protein [Bacteroidales bacterium]|nr:carboxypeptidase-like regulatory domain-containing protein [Bacteroidales bacterium]